MKRFLYYFILIMFFYLIIALPSQASGVICNSTKTTCTVGKYTLHGLNLYVKDGVMCNSNRTLCTNGYTVYRGSGVNFKTSSNENKKQNKKQNIQVNRYSSADVLKILSDLYSKDLIKQNEFNRMKSKLHTVDIDKILELQKIGNLYQNNMIKQSEYNSIKNQILR